MNGIKILYTNWKGVTAWRQIVPQNLWMGSTEFHPEVQLLMRALDLDKNETRDFSVRDIKQWDPEDAEVRTWISRVRTHGL